MKIVLLHDQNSIGLVIAFLLVVVWFCVDGANVYTGKKKDRMMMPGLHTIVNIYFVKSGFYVGWRYKKKTFIASLFFFPLAFDYLNVSWYQPFVC